ncbi:MAG: MTH1187 family thiamine-binding protein [Nitriliruptor sp.]|uniref:MTH1187 family thiamine-binding protein n=1 Tax=Nitriliruptor sp. TaxID=2448056 RepID=UPI0034A01467
MIAAFSMSPMGPSDSVSAEVAEVVRLVRASGLPNETNAMFTLVEGPVPEVFDLMQRCIELLLERGAPRVAATIKLDVRPGHEDGLRSKLVSVEAALERDATERPSSPTRSGAAGG